MAGQQLSIPDLTARFAAQESLAAIPAAEVEWLAAHGRLRAFDDGAMLYGKNGEGEDLRSVFVVLHGRFSVRVITDGVEREVREVKAGEFSGYLPYTRIAKAAAHMVADDHVEIFAIDESDIREMTRQCYAFTALCVHAMVDRARTFKGDDLHREKMAALGRLSAGLAHELNNPSSAMARSADELGTAFREVVSAAQALGAARPTDARARAVDALRAACARAPAEPVSSLEQSDREELFLEWLDGRQLDSGAAYALAATGLTIADLDEASDALDADTLGVAVRFVAAEAAVQQLTTAIAGAATRVHTLVAAVKAHTHMDRGAAPEPIALATHLADALTLLRSKANAKGVTLELAAEPALPPVQGIVSELNHVWLNLVDNAINAAPDPGRVTVSAGTDRECVVVKVIDNGRGIPEAEIGRIFDPFYTTKDVGQGAGLGLDVVRAVLRNHRGTVDVVSQPGHTEFRVVLPVFAGGSGPVSG